MVDEELEEAETDVGRRTAPQGPYSMRDVGIGFAITVVGMAIVFGVPILLL